MGVWTIRPASVDDAEAIETLRVGVWTQVYRALLDHLTNALRNLGRASAILWTFRDLRDLGHESAILWTFRDNPFYEANGWTYDRHGDFDLHGPEPMSAPAVRYVRPLDGVP